MTNDAREAWRSPIRLVLSGLLLILVFSVASPEPAFAKDSSGESRVAESRRDDRGALERWRDAAPRERREMRARSRERWERATPRERRIFRRGMVGLRHAVPEFSEIERLVLLRNLFALPKAERQALRKRLRKIDDLSVSERAQLIQELRAIADRPSGESDRIGRNVDRWKDMPEADREQYREQMRRFRALSTEQRRKLLNEWEDPEHSTKSVDGASKRP